MRTQVACQLVGRSASHRWAASAMDTEETLHAEFRRKRLRVDVSSVTMTAIAKMASKAELGDAKQDGLDFQTVLTNTVGNKQALRAEEANVLNACFSM